MWDLAGQELTGRYGTWFERTYELAGSTEGGVVLLMSAEQAPGTDWERCTPDVFYGENTRWTLVVPAAEITDVHHTIAQGMIGGVSVDLLAQRCDGAWAVFSGEKEINVLVRLGLAIEDGLWNGWVPKQEVSAITRASYTPFPEAC
jgi:hypothetical protein